MSLVAFVNEVEAAVGSEDPIRRLETLRAITTLFVSQAPSLNETHIGVFDEVILRLSRDVERRARIKLAERLADIGNAPRKVVRDLAYDEAIQVAGPVLERSPRLEEEDLVAIASGHGQDHLLALSRRPALSDGRSRCSSSFRSRRRSGSCVSSRRASGQRRPERPQREWSISPRFFDQTNALVTTSV
jgi:uncharacterized protein (DUF2336 family)